MTEELGIRTDTGIRARALASRILNAWKSASKRGDKRNAEAAVDIANDLPKVHTKKQHLEWIAAWGRSNDRELKEKETPPQSTVDKSFAELEDGELAWPGLAWLGLGLAWLALFWPGLARPGVA